MVALCQACFVALVDRADRRAPFGFAQPGGSQSRPIPPEKPDDKMHSKP